MLSLIVPTLNARHTLDETLRSVTGASLADDLIVTDGGSGDGTVDVAASHGARVVLGPAGRGGQLARGVAAATGDWFLFLHADSRLAAGWGEAAQAFMANPANKRTAAVFRLTLDDDAPAARRVEALANWRARVLGLPYGDQGLLISRDFYRALGGFDDIPLMEDVAMVRRIGRRRLVFFDVAVCTSADRYRRDGYWRRPIKNLFLLALYYCGVPPTRLARMYG